MILIPTYSGIFDTDKKTCLVYFDGDKFPYVCNKYQPVSIINLSQDKIKGLDELFKDNLSSLAIDYHNDQHISNLLASLDEYNVILYTEDSIKIEYFIFNNVYGFRNNVGVGTTIHSEWDTREWFSYIQKQEMKVK